MIKGSTKVGEIFVCGPETQGELKVLNRFLGKAITGLGGGCHKMFVIEGKFRFQLVRCVFSFVTPFFYKEGQSCVPVHPTNEYNYKNENFEEDERPSGRKYQALSHQKFGMTPFEHQQHNVHLQNPLAHVDQKIEERESLRHSTHRSQRSDRAANIAGAQLSGQHTAHVTGQPNLLGTQTMNKNPMQNTHSDKFGQTDYNLSENHERPAFQHNSNHNEGEMNEEEYEMGQAVNINQTNYAANNAVQAQFGTADKMGQLLQISCGRDHYLNLTRDGDVFSCGSGTFSAAGHGGSKTMPVPSILKPMRDKRVIKIATGESHSLILTDKGDIYSWGRGFEGQLGLSASIEVASTPQYIKTFYGKPVYHIEAGAFFSLAITRDGKLFGWGEAKMGQLGLGKMRDIRLPQQIHITEG